MKIYIKQLNKIILLSFIFNLFLGCQDSISKKIETNNVNSKIVKNNDNVFLYINTNDSTNRIFRVDSLLFICKYPLNIHKCEGKTNFKFLENNYTLNCSDTQILIQEMKSRALKSTFKRKKLFRIRNIDSITFIIYNYYDYHDSVHYSPFYSVSADFKSNKFRNNIDGEIINMTKEEASVFKHSIDYLSFNKEFDTNLNKSNHYPFENHYIYMYHQGKMEVFQFNVEDPNAINLKHIDILCAYFLGTKYDFFKFNRY
ncbi:MAG: hypothetical protein R2852_05540 [Bacteroidia bacterium]